MPNSKQEALDELLNDLRSSDARNIADEISKVITRGRTEEIETKGRTKELSQRPLRSDEAYEVAIEILIAALEPLIMQKHVLLELENYVGNNASIMWLQDFVEKSPISPEIADSIYLPESEDVNSLERDLKHLIELLGEA